MTDDARGLRIHFVDGSTLAVSFPRQKDNEIAAELAREAILKDRMIAIEADGCVHFVPFDNVKYISVYPVPENLGKNVIRGATLRD
ncbi:MAG TPA: hypothetical protein VML91_17615 [Burkholderiales bacterium]|nr:hypothetical protein [Burkholderiales bacterium]